MNTADKTSINKLLSLLLLISAYSLTSFAQKIERIDLVKNPATVWEQPVAKNGSKTIVFLGKKGQTISISLIEDSGKGEAQFDGKSLDVKKLEPHEIKLMETRDYLLVVSNPGPKATSFRIGLSVNTDSTKRVQTTADNKDERVKFPKGATETKWAVKLQANGNKTYLIGAAKGQTLKLYFQEPSHNGSVDLGKYSIEEGPKNALVMKLPETKDYILSVSNPTDKPLTFTFYLSIK